MSKVPTVGSLDRRIQFQRATMTDNGFGQSETWSNHGRAVWANRRDVADTEKWASGQVSATIMSRFQVRYSEFTAQIDAKDRLVCEGVTFEIIGLKEIGRRQFFEITAVAGAD